LRRRRAALRSFARLRKDLLEHDPDDLPRDRRAGARELRPVSAPLPSRRRPTAKRDEQRERGIVLAIVLVLVFALIAAVYAFQRRAFIDITIAQNRLAAAEADALARGGIRIAEAIVYLARLKEAASELDAAGAADGEGGPASGLGQALLPAGDLWERVGDFPLEFGRERSLRITIEDEGVRLNLNALVPPSVPEEGQEEAQTALAEEDEGESLDDAEQYLIAVLEYIIDGMEGAREEKRYDAIAIARNLIDWMDADSTARDGRDEDAYYQDRDPPYRAGNRPFLSFEEIGLVEGVDGRLLEAMR
jgi:type II secretory pathway component PulK